MPKISDQKSVISDQNLKAPSIRKFLFHPRLPIPDTKGFTLIELLVVIAVIGILSTVILANYNSFGSRQEVRNAAEELKSELRKYQTFAISGQKNPTRLPPGSGCNDVPNVELESYSVELDSASTPNRYKGILNCIDSDTALPAATVELPWVNLPDNVTMDDGCVGLLDIRFLPIHRGVTLLCGGGLINPASIVLTNTTTGDTYTVNVTNAGEIDVVQ